MPETYESLDSSPELTFDINELHIPFDAYDDSRWSGMDSFLGNDSYGVNE